MSNDFDFLDQETPTPAADPVAKVEAEKAAEAAKDDAKAETEDVVEENNDVDPVKEAAKTFKNGSREVTLEDFGGNEEVFNRYEKDYANAQAILGKNEKALKSIRKALVDNYLAESVHKAVRAAKKAVPKIAELARLGELQDAISDAVTAFLETDEAKVLIAEYNEFVANLGYEESIPEFTTYFVKNNALKAFIKDQFGEKKEA